MANLERAELGGGAVFGVEFVGVDREFVRARPDPEEALLAPLLRVEDCRLRVEG